MRRELRQAVWLLVRLGCGAVVLAGLAGLAILVGSHELPGVLSTTVAHLAPGLRLDVQGARLSARGLQLRGVRLLDTATGDPILEAHGITLRASPNGLLERRIDALRLDDAVVTVPESLPLGGDDAGPSAPWHVGRLIARNTRLRVPARGDLPAITGRVDVDLHDLGTDPDDAARLHRIVTKDVVVGDPKAPLLTLRGGIVDASLADVLERRHVASVQLVGPALDVPRVLPAVVRGDGDGGGGTDWSVDRLLVTRGRVRQRGDADRTGFDVRLDADLRNLGSGADRAAQSHEVKLSRVTASLPGDAARLAADEVRVRASLAGLGGRRVDEVALRAPVVTVPNRIEPTGRPIRPATAPSAARDGGPAWTVGRTVTDSGMLDVEPSATAPGVRGAFRFDLHDLGLDPAQAERLHRVRLQGVRIRYPRHPASVVIDAGTVAFTMAGLRTRREFARLDVESGVVMLDRSFRERLAGNGGGPSRSDGGIGGWSIVQVDLDQLGIRLSDLGDAIPDVTLLVRTRMRDVPLGGIALRQARQMQRVELSDIALNSPIDPFRPVVHIGALFADFTIAELIEHQIAGLTIVAPTIYLGEDLVWFKDAARADAGTAQPGAPWTVRRLRVELGKIVVTYNGLDRATVPLGFRTDASNVTLGDLAALRLNAALEVPRQDYRFPAFDLDFLGVEGELRFDYPADSGRDNVVNTLRVDTIRWRDYRITAGWLSATFDQDGINGTLGGTAYEGYVNGGVSLPYTAGTMSGWASSTDLDLAPLAATAAGTYLEMDGMVNVEAAVAATSARIERVDARLDFTRPGLLRFPSLDALLARLPPDAPSWQQDLARVAVQAFTDYPYTSGGGTLWYVHPRGEAHLGLAGALGKRQFHINYRRDQTTVAANGGEG